MATKAAMKKLLAEAKKRMLIFPFKPCVIGSTRADGENISTHSERSCPTCKSRRAWEALQEALNA